MSGYIFMGGVGIFIQQARCIVLCTRLCDQDSQTIFCSHARHCVELAYIGS